MPTTLKLNLTYLREFTTPVIPDQARVSSPATYGGFTMKLSDPLNGGLSRNGGQGSLDLDEICIFCPIAAGSTMVSGSVFVRAK